MKKSKHLISLLLAGTLLAGCLTGCGGGASSSAPASAVAPSAAASSATGEPQQAVYPLSSEKKTLTIYMKDATSGVVGNWSNIKAFQVAAEKLGVEIEFIHPAVGSEADQFNLMIASNEYPDIILWDFATTPMGLEQLVEDGILIDMDSYIRQYAPNFLNVLNHNDDFMKEALSNDGHYLAMRSYNEMVPISGGPTIRGDLLAKYGLEVPVTVDDWTHVMTTLKNEDADVQYPLTTGKGRDGSVGFDLILPAYQTAMGFCKDPETGAVVYGPADDNFKDYLSKLNEWYEAGLIDPEFMSNDSKSMNAKLTDGTCVAGSLQLNYHIMNISRAAREFNPDFEFVGATWPVLQPGDTPAYPLPNGITYSGGAIAITSDCEDPVLATQMLDYFYSDEGNELLCWGIEGESYEVGADGKKSFTEAIMNAPDGKSPQEAILEYAIPMYGFANIIKNDSYVPMATLLPEQAVARERWLAAESGVNLPKLTVAAEDQNDYNMIMNEINTYVQEMCIKFITGQADLEGDWASYVSTLNGMGLETVTQYMTTAYELYQAR